MKKIILIFVISLLCAGCGKEDKNITINIYENSDKIEIKEETKVDKIIEEEKQENTNIQEKEEQTIQSNTQTNNEEQSTFDKVTGTVKDTYNSAKDWYEENKDEIKEEATSIYNSDKETIKNLYNKIKN